MEQINTIPGAQNLYQICRKSACHDTGICFHSRNPEKSPGRISYRELLERANEDASHISRIPGMRPDRVILLHFDRHKHSIRWFWAVIAAGYVPAISPPLTSDLSQRKKHLSHIFQLLKIQSCLRTVESFPPFSTASKSTHLPPGDLKKHDDLAVLMLTSGSSGNPKAVCLQHGQIVHALKGKIASHQTKQEDRFLNYIGLDHVANLTEIHLHAMYLGAEQTHIAGSGVMKDPLLFLRLIHEHRISYSFATKSLLASLVRRLKDDVPDQLDLSCLKALVTGGDASPIATCTSLIGMLQKHGAADNFLRPGFGMTETCAGCTYNKACPEYEQERSLDYASQGNPTQAIETRVVSTQDQASPVLPSGVKSSLQLRGHAVFAEYFNDAQATAEAFTPDGWFRTGDDAVIHADGHLVIVGRAKEAFAINDKDFLPLDFETAVQKADIPGVDPAYVVAFARHWPAHAESYCVLYVPACGYGDINARSESSEAIAKECVGLCGVLPLDVLAVDKASLDVSSLGKISRVKTRKAYESGAFSSSGG